MENKPMLEKTVFTFSQECNTNGTTGSSDSFEELEITMESVCSGLDVDGGFYVLRTDTGWSINDISDIESLFEQIKNIKF